MKGSTFKRCRCRDADGKELGMDCPRLRRSNGTWSPRHGTWYYKLELEAGLGGKRRTMKRGGFATETDAEAAMQEAKAKASRGVDPAVRLRVGPFLDDWLRSNGGLRATTHKAYREHITNYLKPHLGHIELDKLRVAHLGDMFEAIEDENEVIEEVEAERRRLKAELIRARQAKDRAARTRAQEQLSALPPHRRPVGPATKQRIRATLRSALSDAVRQELVAVNVAKLLKLESGKRPKALLWNAERVAAWTKEFERAADGHPERFKVWRYLPRPSRVMIWSPQQTGQFLDAATAHRLYALFHLVAFRGLRRGEVCGLEWEDLDLAAGELTVRIQRVKVTYSQVEEGAPKTDASEDSIPLDAETVAVLRRHRRAQRAERLAWGEAWVDSGKVFTREDGSPLHPDQVYDEFMRTAYAAGLPPIRLHDLRHGAATLMLAGGADMKVVQALLRHSSMQVTSDTYTSVLPEVARQAAEAAAALVPRAAATGTSGPPTVPQGSERGGSRAGEYASSQVRA